MNKLSRREAHLLTGFDPNALGSAVKEGRIHGDIDERGRIWFERDELLEDIKNLPRCPYVDKRGARCGRPALGKSRGCGVHAHTLTGKRATGVLRPDIGPKISKAKMGHPTSLETRKKMADAKRKYPPAPRPHFCLWCGDKIKPKRKGLDKLGLAEQELERELERLGLDLVPGYAIAAGEGKFCSVLHNLLWGWAYQRSRFPQTTDEGRPAYEKRGRELWSGPATPAAKKWREDWKKKLSNPRARRYWLPLWTALENLDDDIGQRKGAEKGREVSAAGLTLVQAKPGLPAKDLMDILIRQFDAPPPSVVKKIEKNPELAKLANHYGRGALFHPDGRRRHGRDPIHHAARMRMLRRLRRGYEILGKPAELAPYV